MLRTPPTVAAAALVFFPAYAWSDDVAGQAQLRAGQGREIAAAKCVSCHDAGRLAPGYTRAGWQQVIAHMMKIGVTLDPAQVPALTDYLVSAYPKKAAPAPRLIAGDVSVSFREWAVATPGAFPHDPLATADGAIWYTGQRASLLGRVDPSTGAIREYPTQVPDSGPHGLTEDKNGSIWFTANYAGYIGKLDPRTGAVTEYRMPDPKARDPHTLVFDRNGVLWFTVQGADRVGRLVPATGRITLAAPPTAHARPYGLGVSSKGVPFFAEFGSNRIGRIDPATLSIHEYVLPNAAARPRRIAITSDDIIWYTDYARGFLGRLDPQSGATREWASPGGADSHPYGITVLHEVVWYSESGVEPNTLVRFDPRSQEFQTWIIPSGGGVVRNMMPTRDGGLALAESGVGKVALVSVR